MQGQGGLGGKPLPRRATETRPVLGPGEEGHGGDEKRKKGTKRFHIGDWFTRSLMTRGGHCQSLPEDNREFDPGLPRRRVALISPRMNGLPALLDALKRLRFEPHNIAHLLDARGRYEEKLDGEFPFLIRLFHFSSRHHTRGLTWHERLELFLPLDGPARLRMGDQLVTLARGDLLVVDNLKLHSVLDFPGFATRVVVISFRPEFIYSLGSPSHDYAFLLPFYGKVEQRLHILRPADPLAPEVYAALAKLLRCYFDRAGAPYRPAGCKAFLLEVLFHLARHFRTSEVLQWEFLRQQQRSLQLKNLFDHVCRHSAEKLTVRAAAALVHLSQPQFMKTFKKVAGMTLVAYLNHVRLSNAARLLKDPSFSIAEVASQAGFADQSYFDRLFKRSFGIAPKEFRASAVLRADTDRPGRSERAKR